MAVNILLVDDHPVFRAGLNGLLNTVEDFSIVGEAGDGNEAIQKVKELKPDIVVMDITMPNLNGIEATKEILSFNSKIKILALSIHSGKQFVNDMLNAGAKGYLLKDSAPDELINAVQKIMKGEMYLSSTITKIALEKDIPDTSINSEVLNTKLHRPPVTNDYIVRTSIVDELESFSYKPLSLVSAPAGYGKSVLISQWLEKSSKLHAWISLDEEHNDLRVFLSYLHKAITRIFPGSLNKNSGFLNTADLPPLNIISTTLINELDLIEQDYILVLDDYHLIQQENIHEFVNTILAFPPEHMHLVLLTRRDPPLRLNALRSHHRVNEIRMQELAFSSEEIISLFHKLMGITLTKETADSLQDKTEGWIVGLRLASMNIKSQDDVIKFIKSIKGDIHLVSEFLIEEVLASQSTEMQELLFRTSILNRFSASLIDDINRTPLHTNKTTLDGDKFIRNLINSNLFVVSLDNTNQWFRYHHLFQDLIKKQLEQKYSHDEINKWHELAAKWFEKEDLIDDAIKHLLASGNKDAAAELIELHAHTEFLHNIFHVESWLQKLPQGLKEKRPGILLIDTWLAFRQLHMERIPPLLEKINSLIQNHTPDPLLLAEINFFQANFLYWMGGAQENNACADLLKQSLVQMKDMPVHVLSNIELLLNQSLQKKGEKEKLLPTLEKKILKMDNLGGFRLAYTYGSLSFVHLLSGHFLEAKKVTGQMQKYTADIGADYLHSWSLYMQALSGLQLFETKEALDHFNLVIERQYSLDRRVVIDAMVARAYLYLIDGDIEMSSNSIDLLKKYAKEANDPQISLIANSGQARLSLLRGDLDSAVPWAESFNEQALFLNLFFWQEIPLITCAKILIANGSSNNLEKANKILEELLALITTSNLTYHQVEIHLLMAVLSTKQGNTKKGIDYFEQAITLASIQNCIRPFMEAESTIITLIEHLKETDFEVDFINKIFDHISSKGKKNEKINNLSLNKEKSIDSKELVSELSSREHDILLQVANGLRNKEIADKLFVSTDTIKKHLYNTFQKLHVSNRLELVNRAKELGMIER